MPISNADPLLNLEVQVIPVASGGFMVRQLPGGIPAGQLIDTFCANMDAVADLLTLIYTPPTAP
jgi:hypothetical protein